MRTKLALMVLLAVTVALMSSVQGAQLFVNKQGSDANNGASRETAFLTIQKGVDALKPGDTLTIGPGEYSESVKREDLGGPDADTIIRAEVPGTTVLRGDVPAPEFKKVEGYRFVYAGPFDEEPRAVLEHNNLHTFFPKANVAELEFDPGFFHYDAEGKMLYISNPDLSAPDRGRYTVSAKAEHGLHLIRPQRVTLDGLAATGFDMGILLTTPESCVVRNGVFYMNVCGVMMQGPGDVGTRESGSNNVIENCVAYGNTFGGFVRFGANNDIIRNNYTYKNVRETNEHFGIMHYGGMTGPLLIQNNISWGHNFNLSVKPHGVERLERNVGLGFIRNVPQNMFQNLVGAGNEFDRRAQASSDNILFLSEKDLDKDFEFADPDNLDFRLQPDSRFRDTAPDGSDRGPYQYEENIFYVSPTGDDGADGLSMRKPWRTLERALQGRRPGDTVYLTEGKYQAAPLAKAGDGESTIKILARSRGTVVIMGRQNVTDCAGIAFERLNFADGLLLDDCRGVNFKNCTFFGNGDGLSANDVENLKVTHCLFANVPVDVEDSSGIFLSGNLYANPGKPALRLDAETAIRYSDYNNYENPAHCWQIANATWSFADLQQRHDRYSKTLTPELSAENDVPRLRNQIPFKSTGPNSTALGIYQEYDPAPETVSLVGPFLHSTSDTTANIEWWSSRPAAFSLAWGDTPETKNNLGRFTGSTRFNTYSLTDLEPGKTYYFRIVSADASNRQQGLSLPVLRPENAVVSFETAARPAEPRTYYVAGDGNDANDGSTREKAFRTLCHAAALVGPGDTVAIAEGEYNETVRIRAAGTEDRPITFRCIKGEKAVHRGEGLARTFEVIVKPDNRFDGIYFRGQSFWRDGFVVRQSPRVQITRCFHAMVSASDSPEVLVKNCVLHGGWTALALGNCPNSVVENNVHIMTILRQLTASAPTVVRRNIFCECIRNKTHQTLLSLSDQVTETDNCFYLRWPEEEKLAVNNLPLPIYRLKTGSNAMFANPMMPGARGFGQGWPPVPKGDFDELFSANPRLILRGIGLEPDAFSDFKFETADWPYDRAWAEKYLEASDAADALAEAGKDAQALAAYTGMVEKMPMCDRLKSDLLEKASQCAEQLKNYTQAMQLATSIPEEAISVRRQMQLMLAQKQYAALLDKFVEGKMGGRNFYQSFKFPELEDLMADLYYLRSRAYIQTGNLEAAEADLKIMNDKRQRLTYRCGESIHDLTWLRLGDFYRTQLKDEDRALEAYLNVCKRTTWAPWGTPEKPVLTGDDETLVKATEAACDILRKRGDLDKVKELQDSLAKAQAEAAAALQK